jgi:multidrug efflux system membrane fusion protein
VYVRVLVTLALLPLVAACSRGGDDQAATARPAPVPVSVATVEQRPMPVEITAVGNVEPVETVTVRAQIGGQLARRHFVEGDEVKRGQLLFTLDARELEAQVRQAEAAVARSQALAENARREAQRYRELVEEGFVARAQYEQLAANAAAAAAVARADRAAVQNLRVQLGHAVIRAPIDGRTGRALVNVGDVIRANETALVVINRLAPIDVAFAVPAQHLPAIQARQQAGALDVRARVGADEAPVAIGRLTFIDNRVNPQTGTIQLQARFPNETRRLWPGQFVTAVLTLGVDADALVVPAAAVQTGQQGTYVIVVTAEQKAEVRPVTLARQTGDRAVIAEGVRPGETVVTEGHLRVSPGVAVDVGRPPDTPAASPRS